MTKTLNQLSELNETPADDDEFVVSDTSSLEDKRVSYANLLGGVQGELSGIEDAINQRTIYVGSVVESFSSLSSVDGTAYVAEEYRPGTRKGGGNFWFDSGKAKADHDGASVISPTVPPASAQAGATESIREAAFRDGTGETDGAGSGCFVADEEEMFSGYRWGIQAGGGNDDYFAWTDFLAFYQSKLVVLDPAGGSPVYTAPKVLPMRGVSEVSDRVDFPAYFQADFGNLIFRRHADWSAPVGRFMLGFESLYLGDFGGLVIENEDYAIRIKNANLDKTKIALRGLTLTSCNFAIETECQSAQLSITDFRADNCARLLTIVRGDFVILDRGWITQGSLTSDFDCTIRNENSHLVIGDIIGVPVPHTGQEVAWINNIDGRVVAERMRTGAEPGSCTLINNFAEYSTSSDDDSTPNGIRVHSSEVYSVDTQGGTQRSCAIRLFNLPNFVEYYDNRGHDSTEEVISWGSTTSDRQAQVDGLTSQLTNFCYKYESILEQGAIHAYPDNLSGLFGEQSHYTLYGGAGVSGELVCDTRIRPRNSQVYDLLIKGNPRPGGSPDYRSVWKGRVYIATGLNNSTASRNIIVEEEFSSAGGSSFANDFSVSAAFWDGSTEALFAPVSNDDWRVRIKISGFDGGSEGEAFNGYLKKLI